MAELTPFIPIPFLDPTAVTSTSKGTYRDTETLNGIERSSTAFQEGSVRLPSGIIAKWEQTLETGTLIDSTPVRTKPIRREISVTIGTTVVSWSKNDQGAEILRFHNTLTDNKYVFERNQRGMSNYRVETPNLGDVDTLTRKQFADAANLHAGGAMHEWTQSLYKILPVASKERAAEKDVGQSAPNNLFVTPLAIQTDGTCAIIAPIGPEKKPGMAYTKQGALAEAKQPANFYADIVYGGTVIPEFKADKALKAALPDAVHRALVSKLQQGGQIRVDHVEGDAVCTQVGAKPTPADKGRTP